MQAFLKYESYKDSQIPWLGEIPSHWELKKHKYFMIEKKAVVGKQSSDYTLLSLTLKGVIARDMDNPQGKFPAEFNTYKIVHPNDLIFCLFDIEETPRTVGLAQHHGMITGAYTVMECQPAVSAKYLSYFYLYLDTDKKLKPLYTGLRKVIQRETFMSIKSPLPPRDEQDRIANFLDQKTAEIDEAIAKKQRLIELLKEQKAILINQALTKGLNPDVPMRDSGEECIGQVPENWYITRLKNICKIAGRIGFRGYSQSDLVSEGEGAITLSPSNIDGNTFSSDKSSYLSWAKYYESREIQVFEGDIIFVKTGSSYGKSAIVDNYIQEMTINPQLVVLKNIKMNPFLLQYILTTPALQSQIRTEVIGGTIPTISQTKIGTFKLWIPEEKEQEEIVLKCNEISALWLQCINKVEIEIKIYQEYRKALIAEAVTGKIKI